LKWDPPEDIGPLDSLIFVGKRQEEWRFEWENHRKTIGKWRFTLWYSNILMGSIGNFNGNMVV
jgi:hypothetical protein